MSFVQQAKELLHTLESEVRSTLFSDFCSVTVFAIMFNLKPLLCRHTWGQESNMKFGHVLISQRGPLESHAHLTGYAFLLVGMVLCISPDRLPGNAVLQLWPRRVPERGVPAQCRLAQVGCHPFNVSHTIIAHCTCYCK